MITMGSFVFGDEVCIFPEKRSMNQPDSEHHQTSPAVRSLSDIELRFYYSGFFKALKRYRTITIIGWLVVGIGCVSFPVGWSLGRPNGIIEIGLSCATIVAGLGLVWQGIVTLERYVRIALPCDHNGEQHPLIHRILEIMKDVDEGGWQDAYAAIRKVEQLGVEFSLPPLT